MTKLGVKIAFLLLRGQNRYDGKHRSPKVHLSHLKNIRVHGAMLFYLGLKQF